METKEVMFCPGGEQGVLDDSQHPVCLVPKLLKQQPLDAALIALLSITNTSTALSTCCMDCMLPFVLLWGTGFQQKPCCSPWGSKTLGESL
jgi:hypothetical protein